MPDDLFAATESLKPKESSPERTSMPPLAARMRPRNLDEYAGQRHILAPGQLLRRAIEADRIQSLIFYGPPGTGKTSLAQIIANQTKGRFERLSGVESNVAEMRRVLASAANRLENTGQSTILFIDEIHRFNKAQQDVLLPDVESGVVRLIGATTHNPFFFVNSPLVSRSQIFELRPLTEEDLFELLDRALADSERGLGHMKIRASKTLSATSRKSPTGTLEKRSTHSRSPRSPRLLPLTGRLSSTSPPPSKASRRKQSFTTAMATRTTTRFRPSLNRCAAPIPTQRFTGSRR